MLNIAHRYGGGEWKGASGGYADEEFRVFDASHRPITMPSFHAIRAPDAPIIAPPTKRMLGHELLDRTFRDMIGAQSTIRHA